MTFGTLLMREKEEIIEAVIKEYPHGINRKQLARIIETRREQVDKALKSLLEKRKIISKKLGKVVYYFEWKKKYKKWH